MAAVMRDVAWGATGLGSVEGWSERLKSTVGLILPCQYPMAIYWGEEGYLLYNDPWRPIVGNKHPWALGRPGAEVWSEIWDVVGPIFEEVRRTAKGSWKSDQLLLMHRYGYTEECYFDYTFSPIFGPSGEVEGILNVVAETTYRVLNERRSRLVREIACRTLDARNVSHVYTASLDALATDREDVPFALLYRAEKNGSEFRLVGASGLAANTPAALPRLDAGSSAGWPVAECLASGEDGFVVRNLSPIQSGWPEPVTSAVMAPLRASDGIVGLLILGTSPRLALDGTYADFLRSVARGVELALNRALSAEAERERAETLAELDKAKTQFFSNVSHEFRTPLTLMLGPLEDALSDTAHPLPWIHRERHELVHRNALRLLKLVNSLLDFARIEAGRVQAVFEPTPLGELTRDLASVFRSAIEKAGVRFVVSIDEVREPVFVDREMWEKVVLNLLSNALKFTFEGEIEVRFEGNVEGVFLSVRDTGTGIPEAEQGNLFRRFHRIEGARGRSHEGTGIGLALIQEIVRLHGGVITVESKAEEGSTFRVFLPFGSAHLPKEQLGRKRESSATSTRSAAFVEEALGWLPPSHRGGSLSLDATTLTEKTALDGSVSRNEDASRTIYVADDNADMRAYVAGLLSPHWNVEVFEDGSALLEAALRKPPDLVLSDVMMPRLDGFALLRALRAAPETSRVPIVLLSARAGEEAVIGAVEAGADEYLVKPFSAKELVARVRAQLQLSALSAEVDRQKERLFAVLMQAPVGICVLEGPEHVYVLSNPIHERLANIRGRSILGKPIREALPDLDPAYFAFLDEVYRSGVPKMGTNSRVPYENDDGTAGELFVDFVFHPKRDAEGAVDGILVVVSEVTDRVLAQRRADEAVAALREHARELGRSNAELAQFAYVASHDLKEPLRGVRTHLQFVRRCLGAEISGRIAEHMDFAMEASERMYRLIDDLLEFARVGVSKEKPVVVDTSALVSDLLVALGAQIEETGARVEVGVLPSVEAVPTEIRQLFQNLLENAIKYHGKEPPRVWVEGRREGSRVHFTVRDNGIGIAPEYATKVFELFQRLHHRDQYPGTGIGLAICKKIVEQSGGKIWVERADAGGAAFQLTLPAA